MRIIYFLFFITIVIGCDKPNAPDCFQKAGIVVEEKRYPATAIKKVVLSDYIHLQLVQSDANYIIVKGPKNLIPEIITKDLGDGTLEIYNDNTCNFVRSYKNQYTVTIFGDIEEIESHGTGDVTSLQVIDRDYFLINCHEASGSISLALNCDSVRCIIHNGVSDVHLVGTANEVHLYNAGINSIDASQLSSSHAYVNSESINFVRVSCISYLFAEINSTGSVYYRGNPSNIDYIDNGEGLLIWEE